ncbi:MAG: hypothetical protein OHK0046_19740 [Anaerolineae bacterium]
MNDETSGLLTANWTIPAYAREALWLETETDLVQVEGPQGVFRLNAPAQELTLRWYGEDGPALARLPWRADSLGWDGRITLGGYLDAIHINQLPGLEMAVDVLSLGGHPLQPGTSPYLNSKQRARVPYAQPDFHAALVSSIPESATTWLVAEDSSLAAAAQDALMNNVRLYLFGRLADDESGWGDHFALPILLEAVTLFTP